MAAPQDVDGRVDDELEVEVVVDVAVVVGVPVRVESVLLRLHRDEVLFLVLQHVGLDGQGVGVRCAEVGIDHELGSQIADVEVDEVDVVYAVVAEDVDERHLNRRFDLATERFVAADSEHVDLAVLGPLLGLAAVRLWGVLHYARTGRLRDCFLAATG